MEFCPACKAYMKRDVASGDATVHVVFVCQICGNKKEGVDSDTLWFGGSSEEGAERSEIIIERASHDLAGKHVSFDCECGRKYATLVRIGKSAITRYVCKCGVIRDATFTIIGHN
jgi:DNA-directed RNA polymerase subunit M/transcription elongation factor TFIIS